MLILAMVIFSPISLESSSSAGAIMRHGPHHSAQKSTTTGFLELRTSAWKEASETLMGDDMVVPWLRTVLNLGMPPFRVKARADLPHLLVQERIGQLHQCGTLGPHQAADDSFVRKDLFRSSAIEAHLRGV